MKFTTAVHTDVGIRKKTNQDSVLIMECETDYGHAILSIVCDGMGGLSKGELASSEIILAFKKWFEEDFRYLIGPVIRSDAIFGSWNAVVQTINQKIGDYGNRMNTKLGSTLTALLIGADQYFIMNVGDSRVYKISDAITQITKDQTFIQREMDLGRLTREQALVHPNRNVLLQCIGASDRVIPDTYIGTVKSGELFLICSDGFRHLITPEEFFQTLHHSKMVSEEIMRNALVRLTELNKARQEEDNISAVIVRSD
ncbi:MAG: protein phosphatase 2C domain-containing protein [Oscillospiraceae bacterium]